MSSLDFRDIKQYMYSALSLTLFLKHWVYSIKYNSKLVMRHYQRFYRTPPSSPLCVYLEDRAKLHRRLEVDARRCECYSFSRAASSAASAMAFFIMKPMWAKRRTQAAATLSVHSAPSDGWIAWMNCGPTNCNTDTRYELSYLFFPCEKCFGRLEWDSYRMDLSTLPYRLGVGRPYSYFIFLRDIEINDFPCLVFRLI